MTLMIKPLTVSVCRICRLGLIKDGKCGATQARSDRIKAAIRATEGGLKCQTSQN